MMKLKKYNEKRNFTATQEPSGKIDKSNLNRFVVQYHQARTKHYDFRLEYGGVLLSWAVPKGVSLSPKDKRLAVMVEDHPVDYADFEGVIPKGNYGAGTVEIFDKGVYSAVKDMKKGLNTGHIKVALYGEKLKGEFSLVKMKENNWIIVKTEDEFAVKISKEKKKNKDIPFKKCPLMLATLAKKIPRGKDYVSEIKYDGYRIVAYASGNKAKLYSRSYTDYTSKFYSIVSALEKIERSNFVLDGEVVCFDENGKSDFGLLQSNVKKKNDCFCYVVFDILCLDGEDLRDTALSDRKAKLERLLFNADKILIYSQHVQNAKKSFEFAKKYNLEGIILKKINSPYVGGRSDLWLKIKNRFSQEFVIGGFTVSQSNKSLSAILVGYYRDKELVFAGKVGTGFDQNTRKELSEKFKKITVENCPFSQMVKQNAIWIKPKLVAQIEFAEFTGGGVLRQPSFIGLRDDKNAKEVVLEVVDDV